jgi:hypothetical protein
VRKRIVNWRSYLLLSALFCSEQVSGADAFTCRQVAGERTADEKVDLVRGKRVSRTGTEDDKVFLAEGMTGGQFPCRADGPPLDDDGVGFVGFDSLDAVTDGEVEGFRVIGERSRDGEAILRRS